MQGMVEAAVALCFVFLLAVPLVSRMRRLLEEVKNAENPAPLARRKEKPALPPAEGGPPNARHEDDGLWDKERRDGGSTAESCNFDYRAYRHELMEKVLAKYYNQKQPPGLVVMNSILLNASEGSTAAPTNLDSYFFGFVDDGACHDEREAIEGPSDALNPMNHFLARGSRPESTQEKCISTRSLSLTSIPTSASEIELRRPAKNETVTLLPSGRHKTNGPVGPEYRAKTRNEDRPRTTGSKSPYTTTLLEANRSRGKSPLYQQQQQQQPEAELLWMDRNDKRAEEKSGKRLPWLATTRADSFNRKYTHLTKDLLFNNRWRSSKARRSKPSRLSPASSVNESVVTVQSFGTSLATSRPDSPPIQPEKSPRAEVLRRMALLGSGHERDEPKGALDGADNCTGRTRGGSSVGNVSWKDAGLREQARGEPPFHCGLRESAARQTARTAAESPTSPGSRLTSNAEQQQANVAALRHRGCSRLASLFDPGKQASPGEASVAAPKPSAGQTPYTARRNVEEYNSTTNSESEAESLAATDTLERFKSPHRSWQTATRRHSEDEPEQEVRDPGSRAARAGSDSEALEGESGERGCGLQAVNGCGEPGGAPWSAKRDHTGARLQRVKLAMNHSLETYIDMLKGLSRNNGEDAAWLEDEEAPASFDSGESISVNLDSSATRQPPRDVHQYAKHKRLMGVIDES